MNIAFVDRYGANSIWSVLYPIAIRLMESGHDVTFIKIEDSKQRETLPVPDGAKEVIITIPESNNVLLLLYQQLFLLLKLSSVIKNSSLDIIHANFINPAWAVRIVSFIHKIKIVNTRHEVKHSMSFHWRVLDYLTTRFIDAQIFISDTVSNSFIKDKSKNKSCIIKNGIDIEAPIVPALSIDKVSCGPVIIAVGRFVKVKGHSVLLNAWTEIVKAYPGANLLLVGDGPERDNLEILCREKKIDCSVKFTGWINKKSTQELISQSTVMVVPSDGTQEGFGLVVAEAMVLGVPIVCSDIPVFREVASDTACYFTPGDHESLTKVMIELLDDSQLMKTNAVESSKRVKLLFDQKLMASKYIEIYKQVLSRR